MQSLFILFVRNASYIVDMEIIATYQRTKKQFASVAIKHNRVFELIDIELDEQEYKQVKNGRFPNELKDKVLTLVT